MRPRGFSLLELLVVIALVFVLLGIMLPALNGARDQARTAICASHLKQLGQAVVLYASENNNYIVPRYVDGQDPANPTHWPGLPGYPTYLPNSGAAGWWCDYPLLGQYVGVGSLSQGWGGTVYQRRSTLLCPSDVKVTAGTAWLPSYGLSPRFPSINRSKPAPWATMWKLYNVGNPATEMVLIDARRERFDPGSPPFYYATIEPNPTLDWFGHSPNNAFNLVKRHSANSGSNVLFIDGHVTFFHNLFLASQRKEIVVSP